jgi:CBS domain-containing protein
VASSRTAVFRRLVRDHMGPPPLAVAPGTPCREVVAAMARTGASAAVVVDGAGGVCGILTERDVVARVACGPPGASEAPVEALATRPVVAVREDDRLYKAVGLMRRRRLRHMPVVDAAGAPRGALELHEALAAAVGPLAADIDLLTHEDSLEGLARAKAAQVRLAGDLLDDGVPAPEVQALVSDVNNDIHRRVLDLLLAGLEAEGRGGPPVPFACIVMGSGGRGESLLFPDQDNGLVLADYPDGDHGTVDPWFVELAERFVAALDGLGFPRCRGGVMATNPLWRKTLPQWRRQVALWMRARAPVMLLHCDVLFDFRRVHGEAALADELRSAITGAAARDRRFLREMFGIQADHRAGLGLLERLLPAREGGGGLDLKLRGVLPLTEAVRLLALAHGVGEAGTLARIAALRDRGALGADEAERLEGAFALLARLRLRAQLADHRAGRPVGNRVDTRRLRALDREALKGALAAVNDFRARVRAEITGALLA